MTEQMIALGLEDRLIAQSGSGQGEPREEYRKKFDQIKNLGDGVPSIEVLLAEQPDLLLAEGMYHFTGETLPTLEDLGDQGIQAYVSYPLCPENKARSTIEDTFADFSNLGQIFGIPDKAANVIEELKRKLADVREHVADQPPIRAVVVTVFEDQLYVDAGGLYTDVLNQAGAANITPVEEMPAGNYYAQMSPEVVLQRNPAAIVFTYLDQEGKHATEEFLRTTLAETTAVQQNRLIAVPELAFSGGVHSVPGVAELARELHPDAF
jgi:iron complex transport system substrate-binding protein